MSQIKNIWTKGEDHQVATLLANGYETPPYYGSRLTEPMIRDLEVPSLSDILTNYGYHYASYEARTGLAQIISDQLQSSKPLHEIIRKYS